MVQRSVLRDTTLAILALVAIPITALIIVAQIASFSSPHRSAVAIPALLGGVVAGLVLRRMAAMVRSGIRMASIAIAGPLLELWAAVSFGQNVGDRSLLAPVPVRHPGWSLRGPPPVGV